MVQESQEAPQGMTIRLLYFSKYIAIALLLGLTCLPHHLERQMIVKTP